MLVFSFVRLSLVLVFMLIFSSYAAFCAPSESILPDVAGDNPDDPSGGIRSYDLDELSRIVRDARTRINAMSRTRAGDFLRILPSISVSKSSPVTGEGKRGETYVSVSFAASQFQEISDTRDERSERFRKALRQIDCLEFTTRTLIARKKLLVSRVWKLSQIRKSLSGPVEIAALDEKIDAAHLSLQETDIAIAGNFAEIEFIVIGCEK
ncbi:MAG TPA: hypothetical protein PKK43_09790 [Spirochaetota bacterium]|nr:hypothetical protein [Spirochaetota bacterium]